jgi:ankyrin repeat protein
VNAQDNFKWTPLHFAAHGGLLDVVDYLLERGADLEARTMNQATPLMRAIESSKPEVVQYFIDKGAKLQIENRKGRPK